MKTNLKIGQKVFDVLLQEWGEIVGIVISKSYPVNVKFTRATYSYTLCGKQLNYNKKSQLSLTEWNPWEGTGKFTPIDSEPEPQIGDMVWGWNEECEDFIYSKYGGFTDNYIVGFIGCNNISLTPPEWILEIIKQQTS